MFFGMYNIGSQSLEYLSLINSQNTGDWHHYLISQWDITDNFINKFWLVPCILYAIYAVTFIVGFDGNALCNY